MTALSANALAASPTHCKDLKEETSLPLQSRAKCGTPAGWSPEAARTAFHPGPPHVTVLDSEKASKDKVWGFMATSWQTDRFSIYLGMTVRKSSRLWMSHVEDGRRAEGIHSPSRHSAHTKRDCTQPVCAPSRTPAQWEPAPGKGAVLNHCHSSSHPNQKNNTVSRYR